MAKVDNVEIQLPSPRFVDSTTISALSQKNDFNTTKILSTHKVAYVQYGHLINPKRKVLFTCHGITGDSAHFYHLSLYLESQGFCVINIEIPGRGSSDNLPTVEAYNYTQYSIDVLCVLNEIMNNEVYQQQEEEQKQGQTKFYWLGTSMGGLIAMLLPTIYKKYGHLIFSKPIASAFLFSAIILNDIGPTVLFPVLDAVATFIASPTEFNTRSEAGKFFSSIYTAGNGPLVDADFYYQRQITIPLREVIGDDGSVKYTVRYHQDGLLHGGYDLCGLIHVVTPPTNVEPEIIKQHILQYGHPHAPGDVLTSVPQHGDSRPFLATYKSKAPDDYGRSYGSYWDLFNTLKCPILLYHCEKSLVLTPNTVHHMELCHAGRNGQQFDVIKWPDTDHVVGLYHLSEIEPIAKYLDHH